MTDFYNTLGSYQIFLFWLAISTTFIFLGQILLLLIGFSDFDADIDVESDIGSNTDFDNAQSDTGLSFSWLSFKNIINFLLFFSWSGLVASSFNLSMFWIGTFSVLGGLFFTFIMAFVYKMMMKLQKSNEQTQESYLNSLINKEGTAYLRFSNGSGQITLLVNGKIQTISAVANSNETINTGDKIKVIKISGNQPKVSKTN